MSFFYIKNNDNELIKMIRKMENVEKNIQIICVIQLTRKDGDPLRLATAGSDTHVVIFSVTEGEDGKVRDIFGTPLSPPLPFTEH